MAPQVLPVSPHWPSELRAMGKIMQYLGPRSLELEPHEVQRF